MVWGQIAASVAPTIFQSVFGSVFGRGAPKAHVQANDNAYAQRVATKKVFNQQMQNAKTWGLHPLTVLGQSPASGAAIQYGNNNPQMPDFNAMGQGIDRALNAGRTQVQRELDNLAVEKAKLSNDYLRTQIAGAQKALMGSSSIPSMGSGLSRQQLGQSGATNSGNLNDVLKSIKINQLGVEDGIAALNKIVVGQDGSPIRVLNTDAVGDNEIMMLQHYLTHTLRDQSRAFLKRHFGKNIKKISKYFKK